MGSVSPIGVRVSSSTLLPVRVHQIDVHPEPNSRLLIPALATKPIFALPKSAEADSVGAAKKSKVETEKKRVRHWVYIS